MDKTSSIINEIKKRTKLRKILALLCVFILVFGFLSFLFYGLNTTNNAIKFISKKDQLNKVEKVMLNPKIKFEHKEGQIVDIKATKAIHKDQNQDIELFNVEASGDIGNITSGNLLVTNNGNDLHFSNNPILIIKEVIDKPVNK
jgi:hypothetical protein